MADVDLRGKLENTAPLEITGKVNPLRNDLFMDLKIDFKDMDLSSLTPYSGRYAGYTIEKGKLSLSLKDLVGKGGEAPSLDNVVVDAKEYPEYLKRAYRAEKFPKPRNLLGMAKDLPVPEMEKLMQAHIQVTDDDLHLLAQRRAQAVKDSLLASKQVEPGRVFLVEPKALAPEKKEKQRDSRVVFVLK